LASWAAIGGALVFGSGAGERAAMAPSLSVSVRPHASTNTCEDAPSICEGDANRAETGVYEFDLYLPMAPDHGPLDSLRLSLDYPRDWTPLSWEGCRGRLVSGDPMVLHSPLLFAFDCPLWESAPFLRITMTCPSAGSFRLAAVPPERFPEWHDCEWDLWAQEEWGDKHSEIGSFCGQNPLPYPCDMYCRYGFAGHFSMDALIVDLDGGSHQWVDTLLVTGRTETMVCQGHTLCGDSFPLDGQQLAGVSSDSSWLTLDLLESIDGYWHYYRVTVRSDSLEVGEHHGMITAQSGCAANYVSNCLDVYVTVRTTPIRRTAWGSLKGRYRDSAR
jgi:hypothetical protein